MTFEMIHLWWWPYVFITVGGALATAPFRFLGVYLGGRISESSDALVFVRAMATALVAAVIANLIVFPAGPLAETPLALRIGAASIGFFCYLAARKSIIVGILTAEAVLLTGIVLV